MASEVRNLAQRSADAAREIKTLIGASLEKVEAGSKLVGDAGAQMSDIVCQVRRVAELIKEISAATHEQTGGIEQVNHALGELDQVTHQNAALVEQSAAAAQSLRGQAQRLVGTVAVFKLAPDDAAQAVSPTSPPEAQARLAIARAKARSMAAASALPAVARGEWQAHWRRR